MADNNYDNSGGLWKRKPKEDDDPSKSYPHYTGSITMNGTKKNCSAWLNIDKKEGQPDINIKLNDPIKK